MAKKELKGRRYDKLIVIESIGTDKHGNALWKCLCDCKNETVVRANNLIGGYVRSCGCSKTQNAYKHGDSYKRLYKIWYGIIRRTEDPNRKEYKDYGGRGIRMCAEWRESYEAFREWALQNGYADHRSIDRINNDGDYSPSNCRCTDTYKQANNRTDTCFLTLDGITKSVSDWARDLGLPYAKLKKRIRLGWSAEKVLT